MGLTEINVLVKLPHCAFIHWSLKGQVDVLLLLLHQTCRQSLPVYNGDVVEDCSGSNNALLGVTLMPFRHWNLQGLKQGKICEPEVSLGEMWKLYYMNVEPRLKLGKGHLYLGPRLCGGMVNGFVCLCSWLWVGSEYVWHTNIPSVPKQYSTELPCRISNVSVRYKLHSYASSAIQIPSSWKNSVCLMIFQTRVWPL